MKYLSLFSGIGTAEKGIEHAYERYNDHQHEPAITEPANSITGRQRSPNKWHGSILFTDNATLRHGQPECIGYAEIDRFASSIYKYHWPDVRNYGDATKIICDELPDFDFLVGGFPCQAFSIAGKRKGFQDTRGTLFFEIARILESKRPRHFLLENVAGLLSHDNGQTFRTIIATLDEIGYDTEWTVINSKHHGVPQNRERVFIVGHLGRECRGEVLSFGHGDGISDEIHGTRPAEDQHSTAITANYRKGVHSGGETSAIGRLRTHKDGQGFREMQSNVAPTLNGRARQDGSQQGVVLYSDRVNNTDTAGTLKSRNDSGRGKNHNQTGVMVEAIGGLQEHQSWRNDGISPALTEAMGKGGGQTPMVKSTLTNRRIRRLTPTECERLQGLPDGHTKYGINNKSERYEVSDSQRYKTLGNAMTVNVISAVINKMLAVG